jgi:hypothetical protein
MDSSFRNIAVGIAALLAGTGPALACWRPPPQQLMGVDEQIALATDVVLARVVSAVPGGPMDNVDYTFVVQERLAGAARPLFTLTGSPHRDGDNESDADRHADPRFWQRGGGRTMNGSDCVIHPSFEVGATYLVFAAPPYTWRSFERIDAIAERPGAQDKWLAYVRANLHARRTDE